MSAERVERRLAAILAADVAGYSRLMGLDEAGTLARLNALRRDLIEGAAHFFTRRFSEAVPKLRLAIQEDPSFPQSYCVLASCYAHMGQLDEARAVINGLREITAEVMPGLVLMRRPEDRELLLSGLRLAMGETEAGENQAHAGEHE